MPSPAWQGSVSPTMVEVFVSGHSIWNQRPPLGLTHCLARHHASATVLGFQAEWIHGVGGGSSEASSCGCGELGLDVEYKLIQYD